MGLTYAIETERKFHAVANTAFSWKYIEKPCFDKFIKPLIFPNIKALDVGCGDGRSTQLLLSYGINPNNLVGIDPGKELIKYAKNRLSNIKFLNSDVSNFKSDNSSFDLISSNMVLHYLNLIDLIKFYKDSYSWLKPNGTLFFVVAHPVRYIVKDISAYFKRGSVVSDSTFGPVEAYHKTISDYVNNLINAGFRIDLLDEPEVPASAEKGNRDQYIRYTNSPTRLAIKATKL